MENTAGVAYGEKKKHCWGLGETDPYMFCPRGENHCWIARWGPNMFSATPSPRTGSVRKSPKITARWEGREFPQGWAESKKSLFGPCPKTPAGLGVGADPGPENTAGARWGGETGRNMFAPNPPHVGWIDFLARGYPIQMCVWGPAKRMRRVITYLHQNLPPVYY